MSLLPPENRVLAKSMNCEVDQGFWLHEVLDNDGEIITPRTLVHARIPAGTLTEIQVNPVNVVFIHTGGPNIIWPISPLAESYRGRT